MEGCKLMGLEDLEFPPFLALSHFDFFFPWPPSAPDLLVDSLDLDFGEKSEFSDEVLQSWVSSVSPARRLPEYMVVRRVGTVKIDELTSFAEFKSIRFGPSINEGSSKTLRGYWLPPAAILRCPSPLEGRGASRSQGQAQEKPDDDFQRGQMKNDVEKRCNTTHGQ